MTLTVFADGRSSEMPRSGMALVEPNGASTNQKPLRRQPNKPPDLVHLVQSRWGFEPVSVNTIQ
jgi:hypothetical protein